MLFFFHVFFYDAFLIPQRRQFILPRKSRNRDTPHMSATPPSAACINSMSAPYTLRDCLFRTLRRWHCRCTHHWFAIDALPLVQTQSGHRLVSLLLRHYDRYLMGTIDPDVRFRDYQNHVIHVTQGYWGGAPRVAHHWYDRLQDSLRDQRYSDAAHAAGVLSHYFVDPIQPLHTMQCARGRIIHRPLEWSVSEAYDDIVRTWIENDLRAVVQLTRGPGWLGEAILHAARYANRQYSQLVTEYDLKAAAIDPPAGLNDRIRMTLAGLFGLSITGWARVLERAASDAETLRRKPLPNHKLAVPCATALLGIPLQTWIRRLKSHLDVIEVDQLINEYRVRGTLKKHLPAEVDVMHRVAQVYADEMLYRQNRDRVRSATLPFPTEVDRQSDSPDRRAA
tara:strand:+ start:13412 stop:14593 length:1182 start_codon:yes stop_codon:yes gene_type:complete